jgi:hypothetical protein
MRAAYSWLRFAVVDVADVVDVAAFACAVTALLLCRFHDLKCNTVRSTTSSCTSAIDCAARMTLLALPWLVANQCTGHEADWSSTAENLSSFALLRWEML